MTLNEIFEDLGTGEFNNVGVSDNSDTIKQDQYPKLIRHINLAISDLYSRFNLKESETTVTLQENQTVYTVSASDLLSIKAVYNELGEELALNRPTGTYSITTPAYNQLKVADVDAETLTVVYKAKHPALAATGSLNQNIELPDQFKQAVLYYVGFRLHYNRLKDGSAEIGADMKNRYEMECKQLEGWGLTNGDVASQKSEERFLTEGWA